MNEEDQQPEQKKILKDKNNNIEYIRGKLLGTGGFAKCFQVINQDNQQIYAAKVIPKKSINQKRQRFKLLVEIKIHRSLKHKHIVEFIQTFEDRQNVYILLEYCQNYTLKDLVKRRKRITQFETKIYIQQIVKALIYIHSHSIIHRDLKLGNILINERMETKICDFGLSTRVKHQGEVKKTICGTPNYIAPEILQENGHSYEVDIWSIGVIMYTLLFGKPPFEDNTVEQTYQNIKTNRFNYPSSIPISNSAKDLINRILVTNPAKRINLEEILEHDFLVSKEELPKQLPCYTIAIPPFKIMEIESRQLSQHDPNAEVFEEGLSGAKSYQNSSQKQKMQKSIKSEFDGRSKAPLFYIRDCFYHEGVLGYLLSNGCIGICQKGNGTNVVLEYGSAYYFIIQKNNDYKPVRKLLPDGCLQSNVGESVQLDKLLNFRKFFITKYGIFKIDQLHKKYINSMIFEGIDQNDDDLVGFVKKWMQLQKGEILTRLNNSIIQLHFNDLTSLSINQDQACGIYYLDTKGKMTEVEYNGCSDKETKMKIKVFTGLLDKLYHLGVQSK